MRILAPAKINLHLRVAPPRADGFHPLLTWMTTIALYDTITFEENPTPGGIVMTCNEPTIPCDDRNLVINAAKLLRTNPDLSVRIHLEKQVPHGGGLGGGSSDAAFTLVALNSFWGLNQSHDHLTDLAAKLGSDIPFFLHGPSSVCLGRGEIVRPIPSPAKAKWALLILPAMSMPTPAVYRQLDALKAWGDVDVEPDWNHWVDCSAEELLKKLVNDLESPAFAIEPKLDLLRRAVEGSIKRPVRMSGSGSSLFSLYDDPDSAVAAALLVTREYQTRAVSVEVGYMPVYINCLTRCRTVFKNASHARSVLAK